MEQEMAEVERFQLAGDAAQEYEQHSVPTVMHPHTEVIFEHVSLREGERILDVACGTGIVTCVAVTRFPHMASIVGVDLSPNMLEVARAHTPATRIPVEWRETICVPYPFPMAVSMGCCVNRVCNTFQTG
jgi:2-polyprenyl-3-methyl-5-hydroxy-6-metoxy-1,4-benzoquinol methylase